MPAFLISWLLNPKTLGVLGLVLVLGFAGIQTMRVGRLKNDVASVQKQLSDQRGVSQALRTSVAASEANRATEYQQAKNAVSEAQSACNARTAEARRSAGAIHNIVCKEPPTNAQTNCPVPDRVGSGELSNALQPTP